MLGWRFSFQRRGASLSEYLIVLASIGVFLIGVIQLFGDNLRQIFSVSANSLAAHDSQPDSNLASMDPTQRWLGGKQQALSMAGFPASVPGKDRDALRHSPSGSRLTRGFARALGATLNALVPSARASTGLEGLQFDPVPTKSRRIFENTISLASRLHAAAPSLNRKVLDLALSAISNAENEDLTRSIPDKLLDPNLDTLVQSEMLAARTKAQHAGTHRRYLTIIDMSLSINEPRLWVLDLKSPKLLFHEEVSHGSGSGDIFARRFSNRGGSHTSSLGLFETMYTYQGGHGHSLRLWGKEPGFNDHAFYRDIVVHGAEYMTQSWRRKKNPSRFGRSQGCPALDPAVSRQIIDTIQGGNYVFVYYPQQNWLSSSKYLK